MLAQLPASKRRRTVAGDKNYDTKSVVADTRAMGFTPHVAPNVSGNRRSAIDRRTTRHAGHTVSQRIRKRVEEPFGWMTTIGGGHKLRYIGRQRNRAWFKMNARESRELIVAVPDGTTAWLDLPDRRTYIVDPGNHWVHLALAADRRTDRL